jgi:hypothetical protein
MVGARLNATHWQQMRTNHIAQMAQEEQNKAKRAEMDKKFEGFTFNFACRCVYCKALQSFIVDSAAKVKYTLFNQVFKYSKHTLYIIFMHPPSHLTGVADPKSTGASLWIP